MNRISTLVRDMTIGGMVAYALCSLFANAATPDYVHYPNGYPQRLEHGLVPGGELGDDHHPVYYQSYCHHEHMCVSREQRFILKTGRAPVTDQELVDTYNKDPFADGKPIKVYNEKWLMGPVTEIISDAKNSTFDFLTPDHKWHTVVFDHPICWMTGWKSN